MNRTPSVPYSVVPANVGDFLQDAMPMLRVFTGIDGSFVPADPPLVDPRPYCPIHGEVMAQGFDAWYCEGCEERETSDG